MIENLIKTAVYPSIQSSPDISVIGVQNPKKSSVYNGLIQHPQVVGNKSWKEIRSFDLPNNNQRGLGWSLGNVPSQSEKGNRLTFDGGDSYLHFDDISEKFNRTLSLPSLKNAKN